MMAPSRVVFLAFFVAAALAQCPWQETGLSSWSSAATWASGTVPTTGTVVTIPSGKKVLYDVTTAGITYGGINVEEGGQLIFDGTKDVVLETKYIWVKQGASFRIGSSSCKFSTKATITLFGPKDLTTSIGGLGNKNIAINGNVEWYGNAPSPTWTNIASTVAVNATTLTVKDTVTNWKVGDAIVLASTDYYQELTETFTIAAISGKTITLDRKAKYLHWGADNQFAEVGHITRNILIQGDASSNTTAFGGHCIVAGNGTAKVFGVEFTRMGQRNQIGRYPFHFHIQGDQIGKGNLISDNSFHDNFQRCLTVHGTSGVTVQNNVGFNTTGHCYFLEEGSETFNIYKHNLGMVVYPMVPPLIPTDDRPSIFWITNPNNTWVDNVAVGGEFGFWFSLPLHPLGLTAYQTWVYPRYTPLIQFDRNLAHSSNRNGIHGDDCPNADGTTTLCGFNPLVPPYNSSTQAYNTPAVIAVFTGNNAYKNRQYGIWLKGSQYIVQNSLLIDNGIGINTPAGGNIFRDSLVIGETNNIGTPGFTRYYNDSGRSRPRLWDVTFPIHGWEGYDNTGAQFVRNVTFKDFASNSFRRAGAVGALPNGKYILPHTNIITQVTLQNSNAFAMVENTGPKDGPAHVVFHDADGSLTGAYGNTITSNSSILATVAGCVKVPAWNNFLNCSMNPDGYSNIVINNQDTASSDFGSSLNWIFRAAWIPFGKPTVIDNVTAGDTANAVRTVYATNVPSRKGYVLKFYHATPPKLQVNLRYAATGEWVVIALQYPSTTFTITRAYNNAVLKPAAALTGLNSTTYYYDATQQLLYVMYLEDNGGLTSPVGFPQYGYGSSYINIQAGCGNKCTPTVQTIPSAWPDNEDKYKASLKGCSAKTSSTKTGVAHLMYNKNTRYVTYQIFHNIPAATTAAIYSNGALIQNLPVAQAPIRGGFSISWLKHNALWNGNWTIVIRSAAFPNGEISGPVGCVGTGCSAPPSISAFPACQTIANQNYIYNDNALNTTAPNGWYDYSYNLVRSFNYTTDRRCGATSVRAFYSRYSTFALHAGMGGCNPGACTASWQRPFLSVASWKYLQFNIRSPTGPLPTPLVLSAVNSTNGAVGPSLQVPTWFIDNYVIEETWTRVKVPLSALGFKGTELVGNFNFGLSAVLDNFEVLFDDIKLVPEYSDPITQKPSGAVKSFAETC